MKKIKYGLKDHHIRELVNDITSKLDLIFPIQQLRSKISSAVNDNLEKNNLKINE